MSGSRSIIISLAFVASFLVAPAQASTPLSDVNVRGVSLRVNGQREALIVYKRENGELRRVLAWGALNARHPARARRQVRFRLDYAGGWGKYREQVWKTFTNVCRPYEGPSLPYLVAACTARDGSHWALQSWQRRQPLLGFAPWLSHHTAWELHLSHWTGPLPELEVHVNWTYGGVYQGLYGRLSYLGEPVYGFASTRTGNPRDRYGRNLYIDTHDSAYGRGWKRESGILTHRPTGTFCHSFAPQKPAPGYPSRERRPAAPGDRYRVTAMGPGVTPVVLWEGLAPGPYDPRRDQEYNRHFDRLLAGDRVCAHER